MNQRPLVAHAIAQQLADVALETADAGHSRRGLRCVQRHKAASLRRHRGQRPCHLASSSHRPSSARLASSSRSIRATSVSVVAPGCGSATSFTCHTSFVTSPPPSREPKTYSSRNRPHSFTGSPCTPLSPLPHLEILEVRDCTVYFRDRDVKILLIAEYLVHKKINRHSFAE